MRVSTAGGNAWVSVRDDGVQYLQWVAGSVINGQDALAVLETSSRLAGSRKYSILIDMTSIVYLTQDAREAFNADSSVIAAALLGTGPMDEVLAAGAATAVHPTEFFHREEDALAWIALHNT